MEGKTLVREPVVNICILTFNRIEYTKLCLNSIWETTRDDKTPFMITVIDNNSTDNTQDYLKEIHAEGKIDTLILLKENIGISRGQNIGWKMFEDTEYYIKIDNDVTFNKNGWLDDLINTFEKSPSLGALGYQCADDGVAYPIVEENGVIYRVKNGNIGGALYCVPKHIKDEIGFWNADIQKKYGEDDCEYSWRLACAGYKNAYMVDTEIMTHLPDREEDKDYRVFKDKEREDNLKGNFWNLLKEYKNGTKPLKVDTNILDNLKEIVKEIR